MPAQALAVIATLVSFAPHGNRIELQLDRGSAEMVWVSATGFHFRRTFDGPLPPATPERTTDPVTLRIDDTPAAVHMRSKNLDVTLSKRGLLLKVVGPDGVVLLNDLAEPKPDGQGVVFERAAPAGVRFYGLGKSDEPGLNVRGKIVDSLTPFLISTAGYGEQHTTTGRFDFTAADRYKVQVPKLDYYFFYGPKPKDIFRQRIPDDARATFKGLQIPATWAALRNNLLESVHAAMSGPTIPPFNLADPVFNEELKVRIRQVQSLIADAPISFTTLSPFRRQLSSFFDIYAIETREKQIPIWHALPLQFPEDPECARYADEFMLGDELLIAPIYEAGNKRQLYLPPGTWTSLETNKQYPGKQTITIETPALPVLAHNGTIVPLDSENGMGLHYFPSAGGEFFLIEKDLGEYTQVHAAPAADVMRLEIESKKDRDYQWVVHNVEQPTEVGFEDLKYHAVTTMPALVDGTYFYDPGQKNLIVRVKVKAGDDNIINVSWGN